MVNFRKTHTQEHSVIKYCEMEEVCNCQDPFNHEIEQLSNQAGSDAVQTKLGQQQLLFFVNEIFFSSQKVHSYNTEES